MELILEKKKKGAQVGHKVSEQAREKMRIARLKNPVSFWKGKKRSEEMREKMRKNKTGLVLSPFTQEHIENLKLAKLGNKNPSWRGGISEDLGHYARTYRNRKLNAQGSHTLGDWKLLKIQYNLTCPCCKKKEPEIKLTEDHIIPLSKGGSDNIENIQPLCRSCNCKKHNKIITKY